MLCICVMLCTYLHAMHLKGYHVGKRQINLSMFCSIDKTKLSDQIYIYTQLHYVILICRLFCTFISDKNRLPKVVCPTDQNYGTRMLPKIEENVLRLNKNFV